MTDDHHTAAQGNRAPSAAAPGPGAATSGEDAGAYARPHDVDGTFAPRPEAPRYSAPPPTVSPEERAVFARPAGAGAFAPTAGERLPPRPHGRPPVPGVFADAFGAPPHARDGFAPAQGTRIAPAGRAPESPWWKRDAARDPWRDPSAAFWLGRGAVFSGSRPGQLDPDEDSENPLEDAVADDGEDEELDEPKDNVRRLRVGVPTVAVAVVIALLAGVIGGGAGWLLTRETHDALHRPDVKIAPADNPVSRKPGSVAAVAKRVGPAVVSIAIKTPSEFAIGSGVVIDKDGDVLTNNHVVAPAKAKGSSIVVTFSNESTAKARIVGADPVSDLAVIKVPNDELTVARLGNSAKLAVGDPVIAIGSPLGLQGTVTAGIVSALNRPVHVFSDDGSSDAYLDAIQTDAPINPGNSGGALVDSGGAVIGINSAAQQGTTGPNGSGAATSGIGYAIPINYAQTIALELIHTGKARHATLGAQGITALSGVRVGGYIKQVSPGGPAARAGLKVGDVVIAADGTVIQSFDQLTVIVQQHKPGDKISLTYYKADSTKRVTTSVTLS